MTVVDSTSRRFRHRRRTSSSLLAIALVAGWTVMFFAVPYPPTGTDIRPLALFVHLAALVFGFGAVLSLDWFGLMWTRAVRT